MSGMPYVGGNTEVVNNTQYRLLIVFGYDKNLQPGLVDLRSLGLPTGVQKRSSGGSPLDALTNAKPVGVNLNHSIELRALR